MEKPVLLVLAAGMGSRYGGLKQMDAFGPNGETIIDYSIYDAIQAGFGKVVFIVGEHFKRDFIDRFANTFNGQIDMEFVTQELDKIPTGFTVHPEREKPWGTAHAVLMARNLIRGPFCVINSDDYYGTEAYKTLVNFFNQHSEDDRYAVVAYYLKNTLSEHGSVNRGVCKANEQGDLEDIEECVAIHRAQDGHIRFPGANGPRELDENSLVSMNMFGFNPSFFEHADRLFRQFLEARGMELKSEFFIPWVLDQLIKSGSIQVKILESPSKWFGVTYQEDKPVVMEKLQDLIKAGVYPKKLW